MEVLLQRLSRLAQAATRGVNIQDAVRGFKKVKAALEKYMEPSEKPGPPPVPAPITPIDPALPPALAEAHWRTIGLEVASRCCLILAAGAGTAYYFYRRRGGGGGGEGGDDNEDGGGGGGGGGGDEDGGGGGGGGGEGSGDEDGGGGGGFWWRRAPLIIVAGTVLVVGGGARYYIIYRGRGAPREIVCHELGEITLDKTFGNSEINVNFVVLVEKMGLPGGGTPSLDSSDLLRCYQWWNNDAKRVGTLEFDRTRKSMGVIVKKADSGKNLLLVKLLDGSVGLLDEGAKALILSTLSEVSASALRCLGFAYKEDLAEFATYDGEEHAAHKYLFDPAYYSSIESNLIFCGFVSLRLEYYFSDVYLGNAELLMRSIAKDLKRYGDPQTAPSVPQPPQEVLHTINFWNNGFTIDDGPLRGYNDPENADFIESIKMSHCPQELEIADRRTSVHVNVIKQYADYEEPARPRSSFQGVGRALGGGSSTDDTPAPAPIKYYSIRMSQCPQELEPAGRRASVPVTQEPNSAPRSTSFVVDDTQSFTSIQLRLADGTRMMAFTTPWATSGLSLMHPGQELLSRISCRLAFNPAQAADY